MIAETKAAVSKTKRRFAAEIISRRNGGRGSLMEDVNRSGSFATRNLQDHVSDIKTMQSWTGHKDLASTMIYLKADRSKEVMARVNFSELAALAVKNQGRGMHFPHSIV